MTDAAFSPVG